MWRGHEEIPEVRLDISFSVCRPFGLLQKFRSKTFNWTRLEIFRAAARDYTCIICRFLAFTFALNMREGLARESRTRFHTLSRVCAGIQYTSGSNDGNKGVEASLLLHFRKKPCLRRHPFSSEWCSVLFLLVLSSLSSEGSNLWEGGNECQWWRCHGVTIQRHVTYFAINAM